MKKVLVFGTFDILHPGHLNFFEQAKRLGNYLVVAVGTDQNVARIKGNTPFNNQEKRIQNIKKSKTVDKVRLANENYNYIELIREENPAVIALGYDQKHSLTKLKQELTEEGLTGIKLVRLKSFKPKLYKSSILKTNKS